MKLRIQENSLRLRLTQKEIADLRKRGCVESFIAFPSGTALTYRLEDSPYAESISVTFDGRKIQLNIPTLLLTDWVEGDQLSIETPSHTGVHVLVEKDFKCLHRPEDQDPDAYPHPLMS